MKTAYKWFDLFLNLLPVFLVITAVAFYFHGTSNLSVILGQIITIICIVSLCAGLLYIIVGVILLISNRKSRTVEKGSFGKRLVLKGIIRSIVTVVMFFLFSLALSFFGLDMPNCMCLPKLVDPNTPGFPVEDLTITGRKTIAPQISGDSWSCDVSIKNNNTSETAVELTFNNNNEETNNEDLTEDAIAPGETKVINIAPDSNSQIPCKNVSITAAEILNPDTSPSPSLSPSPSQ